MTRIILLLIMGASSLSSQSDRWLQRAEYKMDITVDVEKHQYTGTQSIKYTNNSPDTLRRVFYHLFYNAFQPGSMMDIKSLTVEDPDRRVGDRISLLKDDEMGIVTVNTFSIDGTPANYNTEGTILEVDLPRPILPGKTVTLGMNFTTQIPVQIRRAGRNNAEGISYSMSQWYPKLCEYDYQGWHAHPYVGREFHGVWGDFDVTINIDRNFTVAASGILQDQEKMGHGYSSKKTKKKSLFKKGNLSWRFIAENVHDFVWAADPDYTHVMKETDAGTILRYFYQENEKTKENWENLHAAMNEAEKFMNEHYGEYPYPTYAFIQGGDGGMEYPMATLITGERSYVSLVGVSIHEWMHSWYQMVLGTNEALYPWMDEGFTSFASAEVMNHLRKKGLIPGEHVDNPHISTVRGYARFATSGKEEPLSTHADHYKSNTAYGVGSYTKGAVFLKQLEYIVGKSDFDKGMLRYYNEWAFKHPNPNDFIRVMEKVSGLELDWFKEHFVYTTNTIDYSIQDIAEYEGKTEILLIKNGVMPMPIDVLIEKNDGSTINYNIPLRVMRGEKGADIFEGEVVQDWPWTHPEYHLVVDIPPSEIKKIWIDPTKRLADVDLTNNIYPPEPKEEEKE